MSGNTGLMGSLAAAIDGRTGCLFVSDSKDHRSGRIYVTDGKVYAVHVDGYLPRVLQRLRAAGVFDDVTFEETLAEVSDGIYDAEAGAIAIRKGLVGPEMIHAVHRELVLSALGAMCRWPHVALKFRKGAQTHQWIIPPVSAEAVLHAVVRRGEKWEALWSALSPAVAVEDAYPVAQGSLAPESLTPEEKAVLAASSGLVPVDHVAGECGLTRFETAYILSLLVNEGLVMLHEGPADSAAIPPPALPPAAEHAFETLPPVTPSAAYPAPLAVPPVAVPPVTAAAIPSSEVIPAAGAAATPVIPREDAGEGTPEEAGVGPVPVPVTEVLAQASTPTHVEAMENSSALATAVEPVPAAPSAETGAAATDLAAFFATPSPAAPETLPTVAPVPPVPVMPVPAVGALVEPIAPNDTAAADVHVETQDAHTEERGGLEADLARFAQHVQDATLDLGRAQTAASDSRLSLRQTEDALQDAARERDHAHAWEAAAKDALRVAQAEADAAAAAAEQAAERVGAITAAVGDIRDRADMDDREVARAHERLKEATAQHTDVLQRLDALVRRYEETTAPLDAPAAAEA